MFTMTYNEAIRIQTEQLQYYRKLIGRSGVKEIRRRTLTDPTINPNKQYPVLLINKLVPRGGDIENLIKKSA